MNTAADRAAKLVLESRRNIALAACENGSRARNALLVRKSYALPWKLFDPDLVCTAMTADTALPSSASKFCVVILVSVIESIEGFTTTMPRIGSWLSVPSNS
jgi:hypothetical protein